MKVFIIFLFILFLQFVSDGATKEVLKFDLKFGILKGGEATLTINDTTLSGVKAIRYRIEGKTTGLTDKLFKVQDMYETIIDARTFFPLKAIREIKEKKYRYFNETWFYHDNDSIFSKRTGGRKVPENLLDIVSIFFYLVNSNYVERIARDETVAFQVYHADDINEMKIKYIGENQVETELGKYDCIVLAPLVNKGKVLKRSDGLQCFIARNEKIPVQIEFDMRVGILRAVIKSHKINGIEKGR